VLGFQEKSSGDGGWINGRFFALHPRVLDRISGDATTWEREPLEGLAADRRLRAFRHEGFRLAMDTLRDKRNLEELWADRRAPDGFGRTGPALWAGNVICGGDWSLDRLVPDCCDGVGHADATRPRQHVLEPLSGCLVLAERLHAAATKSGPDVAEASKFGPERSDVRPVAALADRLVALWGEGAHWVRSDHSDARLLALGASKARAHLP
jgi:hypothetical protein